VLPLCGSAMLAHSHPGKGDENGASALSSLPWAALCCVAVQADADVASEHEVRLSLCVLATSSATAAPSH